MRLLRSLTITTGFGLLIAAYAAKGVLEHVRNGLDKLIAERKPNGT